jgi:hypothetical protein
MSKHWKAALWLAVASVVAVIAGLAISPTIAVVAVLLSVMMWFVVGAVLMRPRGYEEHDAEGHVERESR